MLKKYPNLFTYQLNITSNYRENNFENCIKLADELPRFYSFQPDTLSIIALSCSILGFHQKAINSYKKIFDFIPEFSKWPHDIKHNYALALLHIGETQTSVDTFTQMVDTDRDTFAASYVQLANILIGLNRKTLAFETIDKAKSKFRTKEDDYELVLCNYILISFICGEEKKANNALIELNQSYPRSKFIKKFDSDESIKMITTFFKARYNLVSKFNTGSLPKHVLHDKININFGSNYISTVNYNFLENEFINKEVIYSFGYKKIVEKITRG